MHRESTTPQSVGLPADGRRRTPGLRREELSMLAGVGVSWYTWLEQGRDVVPSAEVLDAIARVVGLTRPERTHLFDLAGVAVPPGSDGDLRVAPDELRLVVDGLAPNPAYLIGPRADVLGWNRAAAAVLGEPTCAPDGVRNLLWWMFTEPGPPTRGGWEETGRQVLGRFRAAHARNYGDPAFDLLITALAETSERFRELWPRHEVLDAQVGTKRIDHPALGPLRLHHLQSIPTSHPELRLTQLVPADDTTRTALAAI